MTDNATISGLLRDVERCCPCRLEAMNQCSLEIRGCRCVLAVAPEVVDCDNLCLWVGHAAARALAVGALKQAEQVAAGCQITDADKYAPHIINGAIMMREIIVGAIRALQPEHVE